MAKRDIELYDYIDDHDAERAASLLLSPTSKKLTQCLNGYRAATSSKKKRRRTALLAALSLIENEIGSDEYLRALNYMTDGTDLTSGDVDAEFAKDLATFFKSDDKGKKIMREVLDALKKKAESTEEIKIYRKFEVRMAFIEHKPKVDLPFKIIWDS